VGFEHTDQPLSKDGVILTHDHPGGGRLVHASNYTICRRTACSP
jgi:hypothetical protein